MSAARPSHGRVARAIVVGWLATVGVVLAMAGFFWLLAGRERVDPQAPEFMRFAIVELVVSGLAGVLGGWLAARLSEPRPWRGASGLAIVMLLLAIPTIIGEWAMKPVWDLLSVPLVGIAGVLVGARASRRR